MIGRCLRGRFTLAALVADMLLAFWPMPSVTAQPRGEVADPAAAAVFYSRLEAEGRFSELYAYMHPDAQAIIPEAAVVGWYQHEFAPLGPGVSTVTGVQWVSWTWEVTGAAYPQTAEVAFRQPFANGTVTEDVVRLVAVDGEWRWFFGRTRAFVNEQIARYPGAPVAAPVASQSGASCDGDAVWWAATNPRVGSTAYLAYTLPAIRGGGSGDAQLMRSYADSFARLLAEQQATTPPPAAQTVHDDFVTALEYYAFAADTYAGGNSGNQAAAADARDNADRLMDGLDARVQVFLDTCHPVIVFVPTLGGDTPPAPVLPGDPEPEGFMAVDCPLFRTPADAQRFFEASGPGDMYGLDANSNGKACEPGE